jgi:hypothetical protein
MLHHAATRVEQLLKQHQTSLTYLSSAPSSSNAPSFMPKPPSTLPPQSPHSPTLPRPASPQQKPAQESQPAATQKVGPHPKITTQQKLGPQVEYMYGLALESAGEDLVNVFVGIAWRDEVDIRRFRRESIFLVY